ncbi:unnamed protein product [Effrenium voratum]|nr:unnamed protein product [Effrenium voratum]
MVLTGRDNVIDIVWTSPGQHLPAWNLCSRDDFVCLADMAGAVSLLRATMSKKKLPGTLQPLKRMRLHEPGEVPLKPTEKLKELMAVHEQLRDVFRFIRSYTFEVADEVSSLGPLQSMQLLEEGALSTQRFIACGGTDSKGALHIMQRAVPLEEQVEFDLPKDVSFGAVWTLRQAEDAVIQGKADKPLEAPPPPHRYVLISGPGKSMLLETTEEIEEISKSRGLDTSVTTVGAGNARGLVVQLTPQRACFMHAAPGAGLGPPPVAYPSSASAMAGSVCDPFVVLGFEDKTMKLLHLAGDTSQVTMKDVSQQLPQELQGPITWASLSRGAEIRLVVLLPTGTLSILHLAGGGKLAVREVFRTSHLADVPPVLRNIAGLGDEDEESRLSASMDYLRPVTDVCAPLPRSAVESHLAKADNAVQPTVLCAELVDLDADDEGPTLVLLVKGRPMLFYRSFVTSRGPQGERTSGHPFPYGFSLVEHDFLGLVQSAAMPYRPVAPLDASGRPNGAVAVAPHAGLPALWLVAKRNQLFIHPLPGKQHRGLAALSAPCCQGLFAVLESEGGSVAQVCSLATVEGLDAFDLKQPVPTARLALKKRPKYLATKPGVIGLAVSDVVAELPDVPAGPSIDEDPLSEETGASSGSLQLQSSALRPCRERIHDTSCGLRTPRSSRKLGVIALASTMRRQSSAWPGHCSTCLSHPAGMPVERCQVSIPGFPQPSLAVGTGVNTGEDLTCRGRLMLFSTKDKEPGILPPMYQRSLKAPVTVVGQSGNHFVHSEGFKFFVEKWENSSFNKLALFDGGICMTSMSNIKNFMLFGDLRKGVDFCQWKEEQSTGTRTIRRLSRSPPSMSMTVLACEFVIHQKSLGLVALDHRGYAHLYQYTPHSDGREGDQLLRSCATFAMGAPCRAALRLQTEQGIQSLFMAGVGGELYCIRPIDDQAYRTITTLLGMLFTRLPFCCGLNPRAFRSDNAATLLTPRKNIEEMPCCCGTSLSSASRCRAPLQRRCGCLSRR